MRREGMAKLREIIGNEKLIPDLVVSSGPDDQHYGVINVMQSENINIPMAATNNAPMCCGEGVCGSCKIQTDFLSFV